MSDIKKLVLKDKDEEFEIYIHSNEITEFSEEELEEEYTRAFDLPTVDMEKVHKTIRGYARYIIGAFRNFGIAEVEKMTIKFNLKIAGTTGIPLLTEGSVEGDFEVQVECKFPPNQDN